VPLIKITALLAMAFVIFIFNNQWFPDACDLAALQQWHGLAVETIRQVANRDETQWRGPLLSR